MAEHLTTWQKWSSRLAIPSIVVSVICSALIGIQNLMIQKDYAVIKHGQDVKYAVVLTGLRTSAQKLDTGYQVMRTREAKYIEYNRTSPCSALPMDLAVAAPEVIYDSPETIFMQMGQENHDN